MRHDRPARPSEGSCPRLPTGDGHLADPGRRRLLAWLAVAHLIAASVAVVTLKGRSYGALFALFIAYLYGCEWVNARHGRAQGWE